VPVETPDTTSFLRHAPRGCAELFKKVVPFKVLLLQACKPVGRRHREYSQAVMTSHAP
jgi:hypothetical protein